MNHVVHLLQHRWSGVCLSAVLALALLSLLSPTRTAAQSVSVGVQADLLGETQLAAAVIAADTEEQRRALVTAQPNLINQRFRHTLARQVLRLQMKGEHERVLAVLAFVRKLAEERQDKGWIAMTWIDSAGSLELVGRRNEATAAAFKTANVKPFEQDRMALAHVEGTQAFVALLSGQAALRSVARQKALHSLTIFAPEQKLEMALAHCVLGMLEVRNIENESAVEYLQKSVRLFEEIGDRFWLTIPFNYLGEYYHYRSDDLRAIPYLRQSVEISEEFGIHFLLYYTTNLLGNSYGRVGDMVNAMHSLEKSLQERIRLGDKRKVSLILGSMAVLYLNQLRYEKAYDHIQRALQYDIESNDQKMAADHYRTLAAVHFFQGNARLEMEALEKSLAVAQATGDKVEIASALIRLAYAYGDHEEYPRAMATLQQARQIAGTALTPHHNVNLLLIAGRVYFLQRNWEQARGAFQEVLKLGERFAPPSEISHALRHLGEIYAARGEAQEALRYYELAKQKNPTPDFGIDAL